MFPKWTPSPGVRGCSRGKNLTGFRITGISQIKDFGANTVLTQIPSSSMGSRQGRTPTVKWGSQELIQGRESGQHTKRGNSSYRVCTGFLKCRKMVERQEKAEQSNGKIEASKHQEGREPSGRASFPSSISPTSRPTPLDALLGRC